jgi:hypothetical protein
MAPIRLVLVGLVFLLSDIPRCLGAVDALTVSLRPCTPDAAKLVPCLDVSVVLDGDEVAQGQSLLRMPLVVNNVETDATTLQELSASDANGVLTLMLLRDGKTLEVSYIPRGETVEAYQWVSQGCSNESNGKE